MCMKQKSNSINVVAGVKILEPFHLRYCKLPVFNHVPNTIHANLAIIWSKKVVIDPLQSGQLLSDRRSTKSHFVVEKFFLSVFLR